ncbi:MAG: glycosyltransferase [Gammaproteobacteria bacterium]|nr:glycosyltransferase [Gammaproteobacteria bacterium]
MKVSVVTVAYNAADTIGDTLESVATQNHDAIEHIVIDGASSDETMRVVDGYRNSVAQVVSEPDGGIYHAMNKGIALSTGEIVGTLNADDMYMHDDALECVAKTFADPSVEACYGDLVYVDRNHLDKIIRYWTSQDYRAGLFERGWLPAHPTFFVRRHIYEKYGRFDLKYRVQSDFELTMRLLAVHEIKSVYIPEIIIRMRMGGTTNNSAMNFIKGNLESYRACKSHGLKITPLFFLTKWAQRLPQFVKRPPSIENNPRSDCVDV